MSQCKRMIIPCALGALLAVVPIFGQPSATGGASLVYSVNRTPERTFETSRAVKVITSEDIWRLNARNIPELLMEQAGLFVQQTNYGGGSPIIRGFIGKDILIFVDGVKVNTATYRYGPIQYLSTIDLNIVERIEIVRGVQSVLSSYALGGIINIITKRGPAADNKKVIGGSAFSRYSSADKGVTEHAALYGETKRLRYYGGATYRKSKDVKGGGDAGVQPWTGYDEMAGDLNFDFFLSNEKTFTLSYMATEQNEVPRTDKFGSELKYMFDPQRLQLGKLAFQDLTGRAWADFMRITLSWNRQDEGLERILKDKPNTSRLYNDDQTALGLNIEFASFVGSSHRLLYGFDGYSEKIHSGRTDVDNVSGKSTAKRGTWTDGAGYQTLALYLQDRFNAGKWLSLGAGARWASYDITGNEVSTVGTLNLESSGSDITGSVNAVLHATRNVNVVVNINRGFRSPNIDDVSVYDERAEGTEVPSPGVKSVKLMTYEAGVKCETSRLSGSAFYYHNNINDLMERAAGLFNGLTFFDKNGNGLQDKGEVNILQRANIGDALIQGVELDFNYAPYSWLTVYGNYTWTKGEDTNADVPLARIPPDFGTVGVRWSSTARLAPWVELVCHAAGSQKKLNPADIADVRIGPNGTPGFSIFNVRSGVTLSKHFRFVLNLENILDEKYKYHGSGLYRPGFQVVTCAEIGL